MTPETAHQFWCPFASNNRSPKNEKHPDHRGVNVMEPRPDFPAWCGCLGPRCTAWRERKIGPNVENYCGLVKGR